MITGGDYSKDGRDKNSVLCSEDNIVLQWCLRFCSNSLSHDTMTLFRDSTTINLKIYEPSIVLRTLNNMQKKISTNNIFGLKKEEIPKNKYLAWINSNGEF